MKKSDLSKAKKKLLSTVYCRILTGSECSIDALVADLNVDQVYVKNLCDEAKQDGLLAKKGDQYLLTDVGRSKIIIVLAGGVFDIIHPGHVYTLSAAKALGDVLVVSVARDQTALASKGHPLNDEKQRAGLVGSLKYVDVALLGSETDIFETVVKVQPDIIAIGYDQKHDEKILAEETKKRGIKVKVVRLGSPIPHVKSSSIVKNQEVMKEF